MPVILLYVAVLNHARAFCLRGQEEKVQLMQSSRGYARGCADCHISDISPMSCGGKRQCTHNAPCFVATRNPSRPPAMLMSVYVTDYIFGGSKKRPEWALSYTHLVQRMMRGKDERPFHPWYFSHHPPLQGTRRILYEPRTDLH